MDEKFKPKLKTRERERKDNSNQNTEPNLQNNAHFNRIFMNNVRKLSIR